MSLMVFDGFQWSHRRDHFCVLLLTPLLLYSCNYFSNFSFGFKIINMFYLSVYLSIMIFQYYLTIYSPTIHIIFIGYVIFLENYLYTKSCQQQIEDALPFIFQSGGFFCVCISNYVNSTNVVLNGSGERGIVFVLGGKRQSLVISMISAVAFVFFYYYFL